MNRTAASIGSAIFFFAAPGVVAGLVPWLLSDWRFRAPFLALELTRYAGALLIAAGAIVLIDCFVRFAAEGLGTPAPVAPTQSLVVSGWYRYVRNPMYVAVIALILGQALLFGNRDLPLYGTAVWLLFHAFVVLYEEPALTQTYGDSYAAFKQAVPRWIPLRRRVGFDR